MPISNQVKSPYFIPKAILDLEIKDEEWEYQDKEILEEIHNQSLEDSLGETFIVEKPFEEFIKETIKVSLEEKSHDHCMVENKLDKGDE